MRTQFLDGKYLHTFHRQFGRVAASAVDVHRGVPRHLDEVLSWEEERVVQNDWTVACGGQRYQLDRQHEALSLVRRKVIVRTLRSGRVQLVHRSQPLKWRSLPAGAVRTTGPVQAKPTKPLKTKAEKAPAANHPWRRFGGAAGRVDARAARLGVRDSGRPSLRSGLPASRTPSRGNRPANNKQRRGHSLVS